MNFEWIRGALSTVRERRLVSSVGGGMIYRWCDFCVGRFVKVVALSCQSKIRRERRGCREEGRQDKCRLSLSLIGVYSSSKYTTCYGGGAQLPGGNGWDMMD